MLLTHDMTCFIGEINHIVDFIVNTVKIREKTIKTF